MRKSVGIIGGGASGCFFAIALKEMCDDIDVTIYEKQDRVLKKLLITGNGRCNLSNLSFDAYKNYNNIDFVKAVFDKFSPKDTLNFFNNTLFLETSNIGELVYPYSFQSNSVVSILLNHLKRLNINIECNKKITNIQDLQHDYIIVSVGSNSGGGENTFDIFDSLHIRVEKQLPSLCPILCNPEDVKHLAGIRAKVVVSMGSDREEGEILFKNSAVSGIVIFQLSAKYTNQDCLYVDFLPQYSYAQVDELLQKRKSKFENDDLIGLFAKNIGQAILKRNNTIENIKKYKIRILGLDSIKNSQVSKGGLSVTELNHNMQILKYENIYAIGEAVDIDGLCGGYNLQWAWSSGFVAAQSVAKEIEK